MPETRLVIQQGRNKGDPIVQVTTFKQVEQAKGPYNRNASWEVAADGTIIHKNKRYYLDRCVNVLWRVLIAVLAAYMVVIGSIYLIDCRIEKRVPLYLLVGGICQLPVSILALLMMRGDKALTGLWKLIATFVCSPLMLFILVWTIVGAVWTFSVIQTVDMYDGNSHQYCNPVLYISSAISVILTTILLCILIYSSVNYFRRGVTRGVRSGRS
ncbi:hypothetical protein RvY_05134 [Ramazzottius varieornatus]|uniref:G-protein coupled receptors family 2 profile 2 domain-containing protein n=1 Tax=Ramazzottius varieornatus TaxID=947166 RepID=A0A1D1UUL0_RAMVA|nr:hypothetical protein RvY_05134 [Ramazzottius varieornatus]